MARKEKELGVHGVFGPTLSRIFGLLDWQDLASAALVSKVRPRSLPALLAYKCARLFTMLNLSCLPFRSATDMILSGQAIKTTSVRQIRLEYIIVHERHGIACAS